MRAWLRILKTPLPIFTLDSSKQANMQWTFVRSSFAIELHERGEHSGEVTLEKVAAASKPSSRLSDGKTASVGKDGAGVQGRRSRPVPDQALSPRISLSKRWQLLLSRPDCAWTCTPFLPVSGTAAPIRRLSCASRRRIELGYQAVSSDYSVVKAIYKFTPNSMHYWAMAPRVHYREQSILVIKSIVWIEAGGTGIFNIQNQGFQQGDPQVRQSRFVLNLYSNEGSVEFIFFEKNYRNSAGVTNLKSIASSNLFGRLPWMRGLPRESRRSESQS
jgi:hypothetical protein